MEELSIVTWEQAKRLRALGFDWWSDAAYNEIGVLEGGRNHKNGVGALGHWVSAPTVLLAHKWLRKKMDCHPSVWYVDDLNHYDYGVFSNKWGGYFYERKFDSHEEAESAALDAALKNLERWASLTKKESQRNTLI